MEPGEGGQGRRKHHRVEKKLIATHATGVDVYVLVIMYSIW